MGFVISIILAYLIGSISCAILIAKLLKLPDPRSQGSGSAGATNMLRLSGKNVAIAVLAGDALKGLIAVLIARMLHCYGSELAFVALAVVVGHVFPLYFNFKGGKGVATFGGAMLGLSFWVGIFLIITWLIVVFMFRYASLAGIIAAVAAPIFMLIAHHKVYLVPTLLMSLLIIWKHWENIDRLRKGTESKIQF